MSKSSGPSALPPARPDREQIDAEAHIAGLDDCRMAGGGGDLRIVVRRAARGADDMHDARLRSIAGKLDASGRQAEIEHPIGLGEGGQRIVGDGDADRADAGELSCILADAASLPLQRGRQTLRRGSLDCRGSASDPCGRRRRQRPDPSRSSVLPFSVVSKPRQRRPSVSTPKRSGVAGIGRKADQRGQRMGDDIDRDVRISLLVRRLVLEGSAEIAGLQRRHDLLGDAAGEEDAAAALEHQRQVAGRAAEAGDEEVERLLGGRVGLASAAVVISAGVVKRGGLPSAWRRRGRC